MLAKIMPSFIPLTVLYHFNQFGTFQPYIGGGVAAVFSFQTKDEFNTGVIVDPTVGLVLQGGADVMIDQHWGWTFDVKKLFADVHLARDRRQFGRTLGFAYSLANSIRSRARRRPISSHGFSRPASPIASDQIGRSRIAAACA